MCVVFQHFGTECVHVITPLVVQSTLSPLPPTLQKNPCWIACPQTSDSVVASPRDNIEILVWLYFFLKFPFGIPSGDLTESPLKSHGFGVIALLVYCLDQHCFPSTSSPIHASRCEIVSARGFHATYRNACAWPVRVARLIIHIK
jgi:hypothetical protein